jgi:hypothetical protein
VEDYDTSCAGFLPGPVAAIPHTPILVSTRPAVWM